MLDACIYLSPYEEKFLKKNDLFQKIPSNWNQLVNTDSFPSYLAASHGHLDAFLKVWQNNAHEYVGFFYDHYLLSFSENKYDRDVTLPYIGKHDLSYYGWNQDNLLQLVKEFDVFLPKLYPLNIICPLSQAKEVIDFYEEKVGNRKHIESALLYIKENYSDKYITALKIAHDNQLIPWNIIFSRKDIFNKYCKFLFDVIKHVTYKHTDEENRQANFYILSLMLATIFFEYVETELTDYNISRNPIVFVDTTLPSFDSKKIISSIIQSEKTTKSASPKNISFGRKINIVMSFDDNYAEHACAVINSILAHTANHADINIYIVYGESLSETARHNLQNLYKDKIVLIFKKIDNKYANAFPLGIKYISQSTYYRLFVQDILPETVERLIYLDTDIIICDDIVDLWNIDLKGKTIAGVRDIDEIENRHNAFGRTSKSTYINAGVLVYDIALAKQKYGPLSRYFMEVYYNNRNNLQYQDQDIINIAFQDDIAILPLRWNIISFLYFFSPLLMEYNINDLSSQHSVSEITQALKNPAIFHFIGRRKPWSKSCLNPFKKLYWHYRMQDPGFKRTFSQCLRSWNYYIVIRNGFLCLFIRNKIKVYQLRSFWLSLKAKIFRKA